MWICYFAFRKDAMKITESSFSATSPAFVGSSSSTFAVDESAEAAASERHCISERDAEAAVFVCTPKQHKMEPKTISRKVSYIHQNVHLKVAFKSY